MKRLRLVLALAVMGLILVGGCSNPTAPRYPQDKTDPGGDPPPDSQGFHQVATGLLYA